MSGNIRLNPQELEDYGTHYVQKAGEINQTIEDLERITADLGNIWEGEAFHAFRDQFQELKPSFLSMVELLDKINLQLRSTAQALRDADADIAGQIRA